MVLPKITALAGNRAPSLEIHGGVYGVDQLRIYAGSHAQLHRDGHSACFGCASRYLTSLYSSSYWFDDVIVKGAGTFEIVSAGQDVRSAVRLYVGSITLENNALVTMDTGNVFTNYAKVDYDASFDSSARGWPANSGDGAGGSGCAGGGGGHGGVGGNGYGRRCFTNKCYVSGRIILLNNYDYNNYNYYIIIIIRL